MKVPALIPILRYLFTWIYGLYLLAIILVPPLTVFALWAIPKWQLSQYELPKDGSRIIYDTSRTRLFHKPTLAQEARLKREVDSVLKADPTVYIKHFGSFYNRIARSFATSITLNLHGDVHPLLDPKTPLTIWEQLHTPRPWRYSLGQHHPVYVTNKDFGSDKHRIVFEIFTLDDLLALPAPVLIWHITRLVFSIFLLLIARQFALLFTELANQEVFSQAQTGRIAYIGYYFIGYALSTVCINIAETLVARWYINQHHLDATLMLGVEIGTFPETGILIVVGLTLLVLARVFQYGLQLKEEHDLTI